MGGAGAVNQDGNRDVSPRPVSLRLRLRRIHELALQFARIHLLDADLLARYADLERQIETFVEYYNLLIELLPSCH